MTLRDVDFQRKRSASPIGWVLLGVGILGCVMAFAADRQWSADREAVLQAQVRRDEAARVVRRPVVVPVPTAAQRRAAQVASELARPWLETMRAVELATTPPVHLTRMGIDRGAGLVRLEAEAPSFDEALRYVDRLSVQGGALTSPTLVSHQTTVDAGTGGSVRFTVLAQWGTR